MTRRKIGQDMDSIDSFGELPLGRPTGKIAIVTGPDSGMGLAIAFARQGRAPPP